MVKAGHDARGEVRLHAALGIGHLGAHGEDLGRAPEAGKRTRNGEHHELGHHHEEHDEHGVLDEGRDGADLHGVGTHAVGTQPHGERLDAVHEEERHEVCRGEDVVHADGVLRILPEHAPFALLLALFPAKRSNHARTDDVLA